MKRFNRIVSILSILLFVVQVCHATCGSTDYNGTAGKLYDMVEFITVMCSYALIIVEIIGSILALYNGLQVVIKMNMGEDGVTKAIVNLVGSCLVLLATTLVLPAFFGWTLNTGKVKSLW